MSKIAIHRRAAGAAVTLALLSLAGLAPGCRRPVTNPILNVLEGDAVRDDKPVVAKVGPEYIYAMDMAKRLANPDTWFLVQQYGAEHARRLMLEDMIAEQLLALQAREAGRHRDPGFLSANQATIDNWIADLYRELVLEKRYAVADEDLRAFFPAAWLRATFRLIVVAGPEEMAEVERRLARGEEFAAVARAASSGPNAAAGGLMQDSVMPGKDYFPKELEAQIFGLAPGAVSKSFSGPLGLTICQMVEKTAMTDQERAAYLAWPRSQELNKRVAAHERELVKKHKVSPRQFDILKAAPADIVAEIDGRAVRYEELKPYITMTTGGMTPEAVRQEASQILDQVLTARAVALEAVAEGFQRTPTVSRRLRRHLNEVLAKEVRLKIQQGVAVTDEEVRRYFEENKAQYAEPARVKASRIVAASRAAAEEIRRDVLGGQPFRLLAKFRTIDPAGAAKGGDLGWIVDGPETSKDPTRQAIFALRAGEVSRPVESGGAFLLFFAEERKEAVPAEFERVKDEVRKEAAATRADRLMLATVAELKKKYPVERYEKEYEGLPVPTGPGGPGSNPHGR